MSSTETETTTQTTTKTIVECSRLARYNNNGLRGLLRILLRILLLMMLVLVFVTSSCQYFSHFQEILNHDGSTYNWCLPQFMPMAPAAALAAVASFPPPI